MTEYLGWHFSNGKLAHGDYRSVVAGETHQVTGTIIPCQNGLHACTKALDALAYAPEDISIVARVRLHGKIIIQADKAVASHRTYLAVAQCSSTLHEFACRCVEVAFMLADVGDPRCWNVIHIKREWLAHRATYLELDRLGRAAWEAAQGAAREEANILLEDMLNEALEITC